MNPIFSREQQIRLIIGTIILTIPLVILGSLKNENLAPWFGLNPWGVAIVGGLAAALVLWLEVVIMTWRAFIPTLFNQNKAILSSYDDSLAERMAELEDWVEQLSIVNLITQLVNGSSEVSTIVETTVHHVGQCFQASRCMVAFFDAPTWTMTIMSDYRANGLPPSDAVGMKIVLKDYPLARQAIEQAQSVIVTEAQSNPMMAVVRPLLKTWQIQNLLIVPLLTQNKVTGLVILGREDITKRFTSTDQTLVELISSQISGAINNGRLLQDLRQNEEHFRRVIEFSPLAMAITNLQGDVEYLNQKHIETFGYTLADIPTVERWWALAYPHHPYHARIKTNWYEDNRLTEAQVSCKDGTKRYVEFRYTPIGTRVLHVLHDVTDTKAAALALAQAKEEAERANQAKTAFLANMSHELRTPLNAVLGFTQLLQRNPQTTAEQKDYLETISRSGEHLLALINDVLELSKIETNILKLNETNFDLKELLQEIENMIILRAEQKKLQLIFELDKGLPQYIRADDRRLRQILLNLLGNAIKFTEEGGVVLRAFAESTWGDWDSRETLRFEVEDTGYGIDSKELNLLFEPFAQTESGRLSQSGTGLGLPLSRQFIHLLGGDITVKSQVGVGTIFSFHIPVQRVAAADTTTLSLHRKVIGLADPQTRYRILVVEDKQENRVLLCQLLASVGFEVREAYNGQEALTMCLQWRPHLVWMDIRMPLMDGYEATRLIRQQPQTKDTPIIALTASAFMDEQQFVFEAGCNDLVRKPFRDIEIFDKMAEYLGVRYIYQDQAPVELLSLEALSKEMLLLPSAWLHQFYEVVQTANFNQQISLIAEIYPQSPLVAETLTHYVNRFAYDELLTLMAETTQNYPNE